ncbi:hypothetical protein H012_gp362 [Acanthamoeba polyphaga moumouvirus]|uniref:Uncharacterized protein n=2 Tax=Moumouvirus TaxID=3080801 RepID=L7RC43_9VIRU|nr:hypothetical protein H012_gp362 [Acanthamoeba polyphaga moumouvirus]AEX62596.1 hypothetical protein mv_R391 [Moumouvirus Monve]AGC02094.1 hypothetical protein Moumou_00566 [Acanthamoeba polyphaga moumouvirus]AQN68466.1 hypothetical protein [Saudi moumouvirus]
MGIFEVEKFINNNTPGLEYNFTNPWIVYKNKNSCKFETIAGFWTIFNEPLEFGRTTILRENFIHSNLTTNANCKLLSIKFRDNIDIYSVFLKCLLGIVGETFTCKGIDSLNIYGLSYINEPDSKKIIIWISKNIDIERYKLNIISTDIKKAVTDPIIFINCSCTTI